MDEKDDATYEVAKSFQLNQQVMLSEKSFGQQFWSGPGTIIKIKKNKIEVQFGKKKAINTILSSERNVKRKGIYYDMHHHIVYFAVQGRPAFPGEPGVESKYNLYHKADLNTKQVSILPHDDCESPKRCIHEVT